MFAHHAIHLVFTSHLIDFCNFFDFFDYFILIFHFVRDDTFLMDMLSSQAETIGHHTHTTESHGRTPNHRIEQEAIDGIEYTCRNGHTDKVVDECPEEVLADGAHGELRKTDGFRNLQQVGRKDGDHRRIHGNVASMPHRDAEVGLCKGGTIVDAIAHHCHLLALRLKFLDEGRLFLWQDSGLVMSDAYLSSHLAGSFRLVSRKHPYLDALFMKLLDGFWGSRFQPVGNGQHAPCLPLIGKGYHGLGFACPLFGF